MYEGMAGTRGLTMWPRKDETRSVGPLPIGSNSMVILLKKVHTLCSHLVRWMQVGMGVCVYIACFFHAVY